MKKYLVGLAHDEGQINVEADEFFRSDDGQLVFTQDDEEFCVVADGKWVYVVEDKGEE